MTRYAEMQAVLLDCMEFFRDELNAHTCELIRGPIGERMERVFRELCDRCDKALGEPSVADAQRIREKAKA